MNATPPPSMGDRVLSRRTAGSSYRYRLAKTRADVCAAQSLRFQVFNLEMREGLEESYRTLLDADAFDEVCDHLLVEDALSGEVVGTYRLQTGLTAGRKLGYYSAQEFEFAPYEHLRSEMVELGRACVHSNHRNLVVLGLLWKGIACYARERSARYLIGCSSLSTIDEAVGARVYESLARFSAPPELHTQPVPEFRCNLETKAEGIHRAPKLLSAYLSLGAKICAPPAIDRQFGSIDFLTLIDLEALPQGVLSKILSR